MIDLVRATTFHGREGAVANAFRYSVDFVLLEDGASGPALWGGPLGRVRQRDHGGARGAGRGAAWAREVFAAAGIATDGARLSLLTQPRVLGLLFNPVSFWLLERDGLRAAIAEVNNTFGDRHSYLIRHADGRPIGPGDRLGAEKAFHVSPFQPVAGSYSFRIDLRPDRIAIGIDFRHGSERLYATLTGRRRPLRSTDLLWGLARRPVGAARVLGLIHLQALKLKLSGAPYRPRPTPPAHEVSS